MAARGRTRWWLLAAILAVPALVLVWVVVTVVRAATSDYPLGGAPEKVSCARALKFGGGKLPEKAYDTRCTVQSWMDTTYHAEFRMPRTDVRAWLSETYPYGPKPGTDLCDPGADLCVNMESPEIPPPPGAYADAVTVNVTYEGPDRALVRFAAFTE
ncbi:hypothetical protein Shyhy01_30020 [Streptomyces hygroscopicus subsp. hygroscopicus]|uniref:hypothetical protein n=1 Tax=Streptomyces sp. KHY 26 TaxID=3097359 RepID=UPI00249FE648|nr:hypothetical protein [Streptomyces hygroscopicus]GLX50052.1 hypothetical protein Shyhy01_30020 [Streptomyces hygroscopicus subsp. hygroscopicus]